MVETHNHEVEAKFNQDGTIFVGVKKEYIGSFTGKAEITIIAATAIVRDPDNHDHILKQS